MPSSSAGPSPLTERWDATVDFRCRQRRPVAVELRRTARRSDPVRPRARTRGAFVHPRSGSGLAQLSRCRPAVTDLTDRASTSRPWPPVLAARSRRRLSMARVRSPGEGRRRNACCAARCLGPACGEEEVSSADPSSFEGIPWVLASGVDVEGRRTSRRARRSQTGGSPVDRPQPVHGVVHGRRRGLDLGPMASTRMACVPPADAVEREYVAALERVSAWRIGGRRAHPARRRRESCSATARRHRSARGRRPDPGRMPSRARSRDRDHRIVRRRRHGLRLGRLQHLHAAYTTDGHDRDQPPAATKRLRVAGRHLEQERPTSRRCDRRPLPGRGRSPSRSPPRTFVASYTQAP